MKTRITELLNVEYPIIQGGMAWVAEHHLAAAVSNAGGLGIIGAGGAPADLPLLLWLCAEAEGRGHFGGYFGEFFSPKVLSCRIFRKGL